MPPKEKTSETEPNIRERFRERTGRRFMEETLPEIGKVLIRNMTGREQIEFSERVEPLSNEETMVASLIECIHDLDEQPVFTSGDAEWLMELDSPVLNKLAKAVRKVCGFEITVEGAAKN